MDLGCCYWGSGLVVGGGGGVGCCCCGCCCGWFEEGLVVVEELFLEEEWDCRVFVPGRWWFSLAPGLGNINPLSFEVGEGYFRIVLHA